MSQPTSPTPQAVAAAISRLAGLGSYEKAAGYGHSYDADLALLTQRLAEQETHIEHLSQDLVDASALHLADEQTVRNVEQRLAATEALVRDMMPSGCAFATPGAAAALKPDGACRCVWHRGMALLRPDTTEG